MLLSVHLSPRTPQLPTTTTDRRYSITLLNPFSRNRNRSQVVMMVKYDKTSDEVRRKNPKIDVDFDFDFDRRRRTFSFPLSPLTSRCCCFCCCCVDGVDEAPQPVLALALVLSSCFSSGTAGKATGVFSTLSGEVTARCCCPPGGGAAEVDARSRCRLILRRR